MFTPKKICLITHLLDRLDKQTLTQMIFIFFCLNKNAA